MLTHENAVALSTRRGSALLALLHPTCRDELAALGDTESWAVALRQLRASAAIAALRAANATGRSNDRATSAVRSTATLRPLLREAGIALRVPSFAFGADGAAASASEAAVMDHLSRWGLRRTGPSGFSDAVDQWQQHVQRFNDPFAAAIPVTEYPAAAVAMAPEHACAGGLVASLRGLRLWQRLFAASTMAPVSIDLDLCLQLSSDKDVGTGSAPRGQRQQPRPSAFLAADADTECLLVVLLCSLTKAGSVAVGRLLRPGAQESMAAPVPVRIVDPCVIVDASTGLRTIIVERSCALQFRAPSSREDLTAAKTAGDGHLSGNEPDRALAEYGSVLRCLPSGSPFSSATTSPVAELATTLFSNAAQCALNLRSADVALFCSAAALFFTPAHGKSRLRYDQARKLMAAAGGGEGSGDALVSGLARRLLSQHGWPARLRIGGQAGAVPEAEQEQGPLSSQEINDRVAKPRFMRRDYAGAFAAYGAALRALPPTMAKLVSNTALALMDTGRLWHAALIATLVAPVLAQGPSPPDHDGDDDDDSATPLSFRLSGSLGLKNLKRHALCLVRVHPSSSSAVASELLDAARITLSPQEDGALVRAVGGNGDASPRIGLHPSVHVAQDPSRPEMGRGLFAKGAPVPAGTTVLVDSPVVVCDDPEDSAASGLPPARGSSTTFVRRADEIVAPDRAALLLAVHRALDHPFSGHAEDHLRSLCSFDGQATDLPTPPLTQHERFLAAPFLADPLVSLSSPPPPLLSLAQLLETLSANAFEGSRRTASSDAHSIVPTVGVYVWSAMLNHAALANAVRVFDGPTATMRIVTTRAIRPGEEICHRFFPLATAALQRLYAEAFGATTADFMEGTGSALLPAWAPKPPSLRELRESAALSETEAAALLKELRLHESSDGGDNEEGERDGSPICLREPLDPMLVARLTRLSEESDRSAASVAVAVLQNAAQVRLIHASEVVAASAVDACRAAMVAASCCPDQGFLTEVVSSLRSLTQVPPSTPEKVQLVTALRGLLQDACGVVRHDDDGSWLIPAGADLTK